ncbi:MAG: hypothetical protein ACYTAF_16105, partial [Planctomycetota bacterium]
ALASILFASHLVADAVLTTYPVYLWWPLSTWALPIGGSIWLGSPINTVLAIGAIVAVIVLAVWRKVTPIDVFSPRLDRIVVSTVRRRELKCAACGRSCNLACDGCGAPVCTRHARIERGFRVSCPACAGKERQE